MSKVLTIVAVSLTAAAPGIAGFGEVVSSFQNPGTTGPFGLAWDGDYLWFCGAPANVFLRTNTNGSVVSSFSYGTTPTDYRGLTYDGQYLWFSESEQGGGYTYRRLTTTGSGVSAFFDGYGESGLTWEPPHYLWIGPIKTTTTGSWVSTFVPPIGFQGDLAWYGHYLWTGGGNRYYYQFTTAGSVVASFLVPGGAGAGGTAFDGNYVWLVAGGNNWVYQIDIDVVGVDSGSMGKIKGLYR